MSDAQEQETMPEESSARQIIIDITDTNVSYTTELDLPEVVFWLDVVQAMLMKKVLSEEGV